MDEKFCRKPNTFDGKFKCQMNIPYKGVNLKPFNIAKKCDGVIECAFREDECDGSCIGNEKLCNLTNKPVLLCDGGSKAITDKEYCNGIYDCKDREDEKECKNRYPMTLYHTFISEIRTVLLTVYLN